MPTRSSDSCTRRFLFNRRHAGAVGERQLNVLVDGEVADEVEALEDEADFLIADARALGEIQVFDGVAVEQILTARGRIEQADDGEQRRLAAAGRAGHGDVLAFGYGEVDAGERVGFDLIRIEDLGEFFDLNQRLSCFHCVLAPLVALRLFKTDVVRVVVSRHVGKNDAIAFFQSAEDLYLRYRCFAYLYLYPSGCFAVGIDPEQADGRVCVSERRAAHIQHILQAL